MAIDTNRFDSGPLAALAGRTEPRLNLQLHPITGGDAMNSMAAQQNAQQQLATQQQTADANTTRANNEMPIAQMNAQAEAARTGIMQQQVNEQAKLRQMQAQQIDIANRQKLSDDEMAKKQSGFATVILGLNSVKNDKTLSDTDKAAKLEEVKKQTLDAAYAHGRISKDEYQQGLTLTPDQLYQHSVQEFSLNHTAEQMKQKRGIGAELQGLGDQNTTVATPQKSEFGKTLLTSPTAQKDFTDSQTNDKNLALGLRTATTLEGQLNSLPKDAFNPLTGGFNAKFAAQGEAVNKNLNLLVTQAPSILGLPASALRSATVWKMIQDSKPSAKMWLEASKAMIADIKYMGAMQAQSNWESESQKMHAQAISGGHNAQAEAADWFKNNPAPVLSTQKPDLTNFYKLFPQMKGQLEQDWDTVKNKLSGTTPSQPPASNPTSDSSLYTPENIAHTAKLHGVSEAEVKAKLGIK